MSDPRTPQTEEAQLPDALDQVPDLHEAEEELAQHGSEDAQLLAGAEAGEEDVEQAGSVQP